MGLHPRAIGVVVLMLFELAGRGYRVCVSTHSPQVLDAIWALKHLTKAGAAPETLLKVFDAPVTPSMVQIAARIMKRTTARVYYFERETQQTRDISNLDPSSNVAAEAGWG